MKGRLRYAVCVSAAALVLVWCFPSVGQVIRGSMSMTVADSRCAVVAGAQVRATHKDTGVAHSTVTDNSGFARFSLLLTGTCSVEITAKGFKTAVQDNISVGAGQASGLGTIEMSLALKNSSGKLARGS